ncbi:MAG: M48 family metalloprotease [Vogesella sp.]|uniref:M48 family metalloprotease n=1 Tax=Vogesella sp. TaxID=1904252 RepID=UPI00391A5C04
MTLPSRLVALATVCSLLWPAAPVASHDLPNLGTVAESALPQAEENRIGRDILRSLRDEGDVIDDAEVVSYLNDLGTTLAATAQAPQLQFNFFAVNDRSINAFALPGGVIGVHSGLLLSAQSEAEVAAVLAHEIAHVTQRHLARMQENQGRSQLWLLAAVLAGALAGARSSNSDATFAAINAGVGLSASQQLAYSRDFEREADRLGMQYLAAAGFDPRAMPAFFQRLQQEQRHNDNNSFGFLRTHPLTGERISESQARAQSYPLKMRANSQDFLLVREKLRIATLGPVDAIAYYRQALAAGRYLDKGAMLFGQARAWLAQGDAAAAGAALPAVQQTLGNHPSVWLLAGDVQRANGQLAAAVQTYQQAMQTWPARRGLRLALIDTLLQAGRAAEARQAIDQALQRYGDDPLLWRLAARSYGEADPLRYHAALGNAFFFEQKFDSARLQYQLASRAKGEDFYLRSAIEARLRELDAQRQSAP